MAWLPTNRSEAQHVVYETLVVVREQLNKALGCRLKHGDFEFLAKAVMKKLDAREYKRKSKTR
jgi:hypothetical protein